MSNLIPRVVLRSTNLIDIQALGAYGASSYAVMAHNSLDGAFSSPVVMFTVAAGTTYASPTVSTLSIPTYVAPGSLGNGFRARFDLNDFSTPTNNIPLDHQYLFLRVAALNESGATIDEGPILIVLPTASKGNQYPAVTAAGSCPALSPVLGVKAPLGSLVIALGGQGHQIVLENYDTTEDLYLSFEESEGMIKVPAGKRSEYKASRSGLVFLCTDGGGSIEFSLYAALHSD